MAPRLPRRQFLAAAGAATVAPFLARRAPAFLQEAGPGRPEKLRLACIGTANRAGDNIAEVRHEQIAALCDVDRGFLARAQGEFPEARAYADFRALLADADALDLDGIVVATPDHIHAAATALALGKGIPVYCEKPLTHTMEEARAIVALARKAGVPTQMGTQIHATENYRRVVELVRAGAIGRVTAVDCWVTKSWGDGRLTPGAVAPETLDWTLWQGPVPEAPFIEGIHPANWRRYWNYGTGTLGDMACHIMDLPVWALELTGLRAMKMQVQAEGPPVDAVGCPGWLEATWSIPDTAVGGPLVLRWFDGGRQSPFVKEIGAKDGQDYHQRFSVCFQGTDGALLANYDELLLWPQGRFEGFVPPARTIAPSPGHHREWLDAIREGKPNAPLCNFEYASRLTRIVLLGNVAYRAGVPIEFDFCDHQIDSDRTLEHLLSAPRREGWALPSTA
ncbi:MAG: Gfo/Idh/MocA family oxidoreductase [Phycisphaerales bacterium]|nr:Gfo/Idh/MocA family oxidoreductase [Phycisphaerales bacterium]